VPIVVDADQHAQHVRRESYRVCLPACSEIRHFISADAAVVESEVASSLCLQNGRRDEKWITRAQR
jgi:hypothetical protein